MRNHLFATSALVALLVTPAFAQDPVPAAPEQPAISETVPIDNMGSGDSQTPETQIMETPAAAATTAVTSDQPRFITLETAEQLLASNLIGQTVYNSAGESLGNVNDILIDDVASDTGSVVAVIVGVGGFLGIGEKNVAISFNALTETTDADGNRMIVLDTSADELNAAPEFTTADDAAAGAAVDPVPMNTPAAPAPAPMP